MEYKKVPQAINDVVGDNVQLLAQLFPAAVKDGLVDFEALREELGEFQEVDAEKYEMTWSGKQAAKKLAQQDVVNRTLRFVPEDSKNADTTENLYIEGDNLEVLKLLRQNYYGAIKMIYIDPPYNTGKDFIYPDRYTIDNVASDITEGIRDEDGVLMQQNPKSSNKFHAKWLNELYPVLKVAQTLLTEDGVIFISIDDGELSNLKKLCDEIFGEMSFIDVFCWAKTETPENLSKKSKQIVEYVLCYQKNKSEFKFKGVKKISASSNGLLNQPNAIGVLEFPANVVQTSIENGVLTKGMYGTDSYDIELLQDTKVFDGLFVEPVLLKARFKWQQSYLDKELESGTIIKIPTKKLSPSYEKKEYDAEVPANLINSKVGVGTNENAGEHIATLFGKKVFSYPKPVNLIEYLLGFNDSECEPYTVLDFFSGSGTTAEAVFNLNCKYGYNKTNFILVQIAEDLRNTLRGTQAKSQQEIIENGINYLLQRNKTLNICELAKERIHLAGEKILADNASKEGIEQLDVGFRVFRTADTNIRWNLYEHQDGEQVSVETLQNTPDLADFTEGFNDIDVVYEIMLRQRDIPLSNTLETLTDIGERTYLYASTYLVCLETNITPELIEALASLDPLPVKFVFRDSAFGDDINLKDETFRRLKTLVERNTGTAKKTYTVEFI